jgi:RNA polymerase sigma factor (sigma-70 family)
VNDVSDHQLLREYLEHRSEAAFREIVRRHIDLVYSAALRMVRDPHLAEDVTQSAFVALAQHASQLTTHPVLSGWLHCTTRNLAAKTVRTEVRRRAREHEAAAMNELLAHESETVWENIAPHLDDAIAQLGDSDRDALLLRYFERKSAREMSQIFGTSEDAAQKRVSRAVERLREFFSKRGVTIGAGGLVVLISANAVQAAPVALTTSVSAAILTGTTAVHTSTAVTVTKAIFMTALQKVLVTATVVVLAGAGIYEARQTSQLSEQVRTLRQQQAPLAEQIQQLQTERNDATNRLTALAAENAQLKSNPNENELLKLRGEITQLRNEANNPSEKAARALIAKLARLKERLEETPGAKIPEMQFLTDQDWFYAANGKLDTDADYRRALAVLRAAGESKFVSILKPALDQYLQANNKQFPTDLAQLQQYFPAPVDDAIIQEWEIAPALTVKSLGMGGDVIITQKAPVDDVFDTRFGIGPNGYGQTDFLSYETAEAMKSVVESFKAAHNGQLPIDKSKLLPYASTPDQQAAVQKFILLDSTRQSPNLSIPSTP